jgi:dephospho-CoA kinase
MALKIGLTGGIASGKSSVADLFAQHGVPVIDADRIARELVEPGQIANQLIQSAFGQAIFQDDGQLNRALLRQQIFSNPKAKQQLEAILHPLIRQKMLDEIKQINSALVILAVPLLVEANMQSLVDRVLVVDCDPAIQLKRLCERDNISLDLAQTMINAQTERQQRLQSADDIINNNGEIDELEPQVSQLFNFYQQLVVKQG